MSCDRKSQIEGGAANWWPNGIRLGFSKLGGPELDPTTTGHLKLDPATKFYHSYVLGTRNKRKRKP
uniref:Uncharacterized protein n=1 Tax=Rhizophora mucronata TaxID=61149 RepID=A0A2P2QSH7_RHIMU